MIFVWLKNPSSALPMKLAALNIDIKDSKAPGEFFWTSLENWQLPELIIASWDSSG